MAGGLCKRARACRAAGLAPGALTSQTRAGAGPGRSRGAGPRPGPVLGCGPHVGRQPDPAGLGQAS